jgi:hypothetical protein
MAPQIRNFQDSSRAFHKPIFVPAGNNENTLAARTFGGFVTELFN